MCIIYNIYAFNQRSSEGIKGRCNVLSCDYKMPRALSGAEEGNSLNLIKPKGLRHAAEAEGLCSVCVQLRDVPLIVVNYSKSDAYHSIRKTITLYQQ